MRVGLNYYFNLLFAMGLLGLLSYYFVVFTLYIILVIQKKVGYNFKKKKLNIYKIGVINFY